MDKNHLRINVAIYYIMGEILIIVNGYNPQNVPLTSLTVHLMCVSQTSHMPLICIQGGVKMLALAHQAGIAVRHSPY